MRMPASPRLSDGPVFSATELLARLDGHEADLMLPMERLFDDLPNVVFFVKDRAGRYLCANHTLAQRLGMRDKTGQDPVEQIDMIGAEACRPLQEKLADTARGIGAALGVATTDDVVEFRDQRW